MLQNDSHLNCLCVMARLIEALAIYDTFLFQLPSHQLRHQATHKVGRQPVIVDGNLNLNLGCMWVCMGSHTHFITPKESFERSGMHLYLLTF